MAATHYLPNLRKILTTKKKEKPGRVKLHRPLDFHSHSSKASGTTTAAPTAEPPNPQAPLGNPLRPQLIRQRIAGAVPMGQGLRSWVQDFPWRRAMCVAFAAALILGACGLALFLAWSGEVKQPICDEACTEYTTLLGKTMDWSVGPCQDFYRFVCGRAARNESNEEIPAESQTVAQKAARLFKTCDDVMTQDTDYVPRIRGHLRDANLHWPQHPAARDPASVDVLTTMLHLSDKWGWPCFFEFQTEKIGDYSFEIVAKPTLGLDFFKLRALNLGPGSPAHRTYFETLYTHYGSGVTDGVTFEEMLQFEAEVLDPLVQMSLRPLQAYVFERSPYDTSGTWERWTTTIARHYNLTGNELITISTINRDYFLVALALIAQKETVVEFVIGWLCVQFTSWFANRQLIANYRGYREDVAVQHQRACLDFTLATMGVALFVPFVESVYTAPVRADASRIARAVRRTVYQSLDRATYPFSRFPDMEVSFVRNVRDATIALRSSNKDAIGALIQRWMLQDDLYAFFDYPDRLDYSLKPSVLTSPVYHVTAPAPVRLGTFGVEVAKATIITYQPWQDSPEWHRRVGTNMAVGAAIDVALAVLRLEPSFDEQRLRDVPLSGRPTLLRDAVLHARAPQCLRFCRRTAMPYMPNLRKFITKKKKEKPARVKLHQPLDFHAHASKASSTSTAASVAPAPNPQAPLGNQLRPQLIGQRVAAAVPVPKELRHWAQEFPWRRTLHVAVALALVVAVCGGRAARRLAYGRQKAHLRRRLQGIHCGRIAYDLVSFSFRCSAKPWTGLRRPVTTSIASCAAEWRATLLRFATLSTVRFINAVISSARREDVPAEGQTASQRAARLFKTCDDVVTQDTDYVPRIRGYMRDANLHWPQHPATRDTSSVDVLSSMLQISDKWGWPCFFEFYTRGSHDSFELTVHPTIHLEQFKHNAINLGVGSPAHRRYFETLYSHYGSGIVDGVTFEEMMDYEAEVLDPALYEFFSPPEIYVFQRDSSDVSGMWERWTSAIGRHYNLTGNELIEIVASRRQYFLLMLHLIETKEEIVELVIGWLCVQYTSWFSNRELIANFYNYPEDTDRLHRRVCLAFTMSLTGIALVVPFVQGVYTEPVRDDVSRIAREVRRTVYQTLNEATYPWHEIGSVFRFLDTAVAHDLEARLVGRPCTPA
ncbi:hypothetical protein MTO96_033602 [Rhipicephalus appendiculatus]